MVRSPPKLSCKLMRLAILHTFLPRLQTLAASLDGCVRADDPYFNKLIRIMATRCMTQAVYLSSGGWLLAGQ